MEDIFYLPSFSQYLHFLLAFGDYSKHTNNNLYFFKLFNSFESFHTSASWWFLTGVWVIAILFKSPGLFLVFWLISLFFTHLSLSHQRQPVVFHWSLSDSKSPQLSRTLLSILAVLNNAVVWMVSTRPPTSKSSSPFSNPLVTVPNAPITIGIIVTCMFHSFFNCLARSRYLSFFSHSFSFILWSAGTAKSTILQVFFFCWLLLNLVFWPGLGDPFVC